MIGQAENQRQDLCNSFKLTDFSRDDSKRDMSKSSQLFMKSSELDLPILTLPLDHYVMIAEKVRVKMFKKCILFQCFLLTCFYC